MLDEEHIDNAYATADAIKQNPAQFDHSKHCHGDPLGIASCLSAFIAAVALLDPETETIAEFEIGDDSYWIEARAREALGLTEEEARKAFSNPAIRTLPDGTTESFQPTAADAEDALIRYGAAATGVWVW